MHAAAFAGTSVHVTVAMGMHDVIRSQNTRQGAAEDRIREDLLQFRYARQDVIAWIALFFKDLRCPLVDLFVQTPGQVRLQHQEAAGQIVAHLLIGEQIFWLDHVGVSKNPVVFSLGSARRNLKAPCIHRQDHLHGCRPQAN